MRWKLVGLQHNIVCTMQVHEAGESCIMTRSAINEIFALDIDRSSSSLPYYAVRSLTKLGSDDQILAQDHFIFQRSTETGSIFPRLSFYRICQI